MSYSKFIYYVFGVHIFLSSAQSLNILVVCPSTVSSHFFLCSKLLLGLAERGHQITMVSQLPLRASAENVTVILANYTNSKDNLDLMSLKDALLSIEHKPFLENVVMGSAMGESMSMNVLRSKTFKRFLNSAEEFDVIIVQFFLNEALVGLIHRYKCPIILLSTLPSSVWLNQYVGNIALFSYSPTILTHYTQDMSFFERMTNAWYGFMQEVYLKLVHMPKQRAIFRQHFPDAPELDTILYNNISLIFVNSQPSLTGPNPQVPAMVDIGGFHIDEAKPLPPDLQQIMDNSAEGLIYFSMGSVADSARLPPHVLHAILQTFSKTRLTVLFKCNYQIANVTENIVLRKWLPQTSILAHRNLKVFVTHGGISSVTEAVHFGVPLLGIPLFGDQFSNMRLAEGKGFALSIRRHELTEELFTAKLNAVLNFKKYKEAAIQQSRILRDQPLKPRDAVAYWVEHVSRHNGAKHLESPTLRLYWWQLYSFDVTAFVLVSISIIYFFIYILYKGYIFLKHENNNKNKKNQ